MKVTVLGSCLEVDIPKDFNKFFENGFGYDQRVGKYQEMDLYYLYLIIKSFEYRSIEINSNLRTLKKQCFESAYGRLNDKFEWQHGHWSKIYNETHCRFSSAGIRLLVERYREHPNKDLKKDIIYTTKSLLKLSEKLNIGMWFCHDSLETSDESIQDYPIKKLKNRVYGKSTHNTLTLNTHVDTLITLFDVRKTLDIEEFDGEIEEGTSALNYILTNDISEFILYPLSILQSMFFKWNANNLISRSFRFLLIIAITNIYTLLKKTNAFFTLPNGYIERDSGLKHFAFNYHVVNVWDLCKLQRYYRNERIKQVIENGFNFIFNTSYVDFFIERKIPGGIEICESILIHLSVNEISDYTLWIERYLKVRKCYSPSAAIIGYDSIVIPGEFRIPSDDIPILNPEFDLLNISKHVTKYRYVIINLSNIETPISYNIKDKYDYNYYNLKLNTIISPKTMKPYESFILEILH